MALFDHQESGVALLLEALEGHGGVLLCDPPGTGKSLIAIEAASRLGASRVNVIAPLHLLGMWQRLLNDHGCDGIVVTHDAALPGMKSDLLIIDEAHRLRNRDTRRYRSIAASCVGARVLLVTATPLVREPGDLVSLMRLFVSDDHFVEAGVPSLTRAAAADDLRPMLSAIAPLVVRRAAVTDDLNLPITLERKVEYPLSEIAGAIRERIDAMTFPGTLGGKSSLRQLLWRRYLSSPAALAGTLGRQLRYLRMLAERRSAGWTVHRSTRADAEEGEQAVLFPQAFGERVAPQQDRESAGEIARCEQMLDLISRSPEDPKLEALLHLIRPGTPALVFTESAETAEYIWSNVSGRGVLVTSRRARLADGSTCTPEEAVRAFQAGSADLIISTDVASEGLNLERAGCVVHYDLAWLPQRLEQRVGRAARIGSSYPGVESILLIASDAGESRLERITTRRRLTGLLDSRVCLPGRIPAIAIPWLPADSPHARIARILRESGEEDQDLTGMLGRRYVAGIEIALEELAARGRIPLRLIRRTLLRLISTQSATSKKAEPSSRSTEAHSTKLPFASV